MDYDQLVQYLLNKYGGAKCDYFTKTNCKNRSKLISRTEEGLICHHIDENKSNNHISNLIPATPLENNHYSSKSKGFKLTEEKVRSIRKNKLSVKEVVEIYKISPRHALRVIKKERWSWVD